MLFSKVNILTFLSNISSHRFGSPGGRALREIEKRERERESKKQDTAEVALGAHQHQELPSTSHSKDNDYG
jgi:hypothetical protein